jgi:hypothetical protein
VPSGRSGLRRGRRKKSSPEARQAGATGLPLRSRARPRSAAGPPPASPGSARRRPPPAPSAGCRRSHRSRDHGASEGGAEVASLNGMPCPSVLLAGLAMVGGSTTSGFAASRGGRLVEEPADLASPSRRGRGRSSRGGPRAPRRGRASRVGRADRSSGATGRTAGRRAVEPQSAASSPRRAAAVVRDLQQGEHRGLELSSDSALTCCISTEDPDGLREGVT